MQLVTSSGDGTLNAVPAPNSIISPDVSTKATQPDNNPQLLTLIPGGGLKTIAFIALVWVTYKYLKRGK